MLPRGDRKHALRFDIDLIDGGRAIDSLQGHVRPSECLVDITLLPPALLEHASRLLHVEHRFESFKPDPYMTPRRLRPVAVGVGNEQDRLAPVAHGFAGQARLVSKNMRNAVVSRDIVSPHDGAFSPGESGIQADAANRPRTQSARTVTPKSAWGISRSAVYTAAPVTFAVRRIRV